MVFAVEFVGAGVGGDVVPIAIPTEHNFVHGSDADVFVVTDGESYTARNGLDTFTSRIGNILSGTFKLRLRGHITEDIPFNASEDDVKAKLEALPNVGTVNVEVGGPTNELGYTWTITFISNPGYFPPNTRNVDALEYVSLLTTSVETDTSAAISVEVVREGDDRLDGTFQLAFSDGTTTETTLALNTFASVLDMQQGLEDLPNVGRVAVTRSQSELGYQWDVEFVGCALKGGTDVCNDGNLLALVATSVDLAGCGGAQLNVIELQSGSGAGVCPHFASGKCTQVQSVDEYPFEHDIVGLDLGTPYYVQVRLGNSQSYGYRRLSSPLSGTPHHNPPGAPPPVVLKQSTSTSLTLMWDPPTENGGKRVSGYELWMDDWSGGNRFMVYDGSDDPDTLEYTLGTGDAGPLSQVVEPGRQYRFEVRAINNCNTTDTDLACHGPFSDVQVFTVREPRRPLPPSAPVKARTTVTGSTTASVTVTWSRPIDNGGSPITGYVLYMKHPDDTMESYSLGPDASSWTVGDLDAGEMYRFHVVAINAVGRSGNSPILTLIAAVPPGTDTSLTETYSTDSFRPIIADVKETEMVIEWLAPALDSTGGTPVTGYKLYQYEGIGPNTKSNPDPIKQEVQDILIVGGGSTSSSATVGGTFTASFRGQETSSIPVDASAADIKYALQNLVTINVVSVQSIDGGGGRGWRVRFLSEAGGLPLIQTTSGRLTGPEDARVVVKEHIKGDNAILIYDGTDLPSVRSFEATNLFPDARYAFKVAPVNAVGDGILSLATTTTIARAGASAQQTTASGGALFAGIAGSIQEEQTVVFASNDCDSDALVLSFGGDLSQTKTANLCGSTASAFETAIEALPGVGDVHVSRKDLVTLGGGSSGYAWSVTFLSSMGDVSSLVVDLDEVYNGRDASDKSRSDAVYVSEFLRGQANEFIIEPKKASGAVVRDVSASDGMAGQDEFFTELWSSDPSVVDGSHDWYSDGGVAVYNPVRYEEQVVFIPSDYVGTFQLTMDTSLSSSNEDNKDQGRVGGYSATTGDLHVSGGGDGGGGGDESLTDVVLQNALSALTNIGKVLVSSTESSIGDGGDDGTAYTVTFITVLGELPLLSASDPAVVVSRSANQIGVAEIQTITSSVDQAFVYEVQSIAVPSSASTFTLAFGSSPAATTRPISCNFASAEEAHVATTTIKDELEAAANVVVHVDGVVSGDGSDESPWTYSVTFVEPVGPLPLLTSDEAVVAQLVQGHSTLDGTMVLSYDGQYTDNIAFDASADTVKHRLELLSSIEEVDVRKIDKRTGYQWEVTFTRSVGNLPSLVAHKQVFEVQKIETVGGNPTPLGGSFKLRYNNGEETSSLPFDAAEQAVKAALETLPSIGLVDVNRIAKANGQYEWLVIFRLPRAPATLEIDDGGLKGTLDDASVDIVVNANPNSLVSSSGAEARVVVEEKVVGLPSYTARYKADRVGAYSLAVLKLESGGLSARYYDNQWLLDEPVMERVDETINFDWKSGAITPYGRDFVSVRWWGKVRPTTTEEYTFYIVADDGVRLFVDHELLIDSPRGGNEQRASVSLTKDMFHDVVVEYREETGEASVQLQWSSRSIRKQVISPLLLYHPIHIAGSPYNVNILPGAADYPFSTFVEVPGKNRTETTAGEQTHFIIQAKDSSGNNKMYNNDSQGDHGDDQFTVDIAGGGITTSANVEYIGSGQYRVDYLLNKAGKYKIHVRTGGTDIYCGKGAAEKCSPFDISVKPGHTVSSMCEAESFHAGPVDSLIEAKAGETGIIHLQAKDAFGNNRQEGRDGFIAKFTSTENRNMQYRANVVDKGDGTYELTYSIPIAGTYKVAIVLDDEPVQTCIGPVGERLHQREYDGVSVYSSPSFCKHNREDGDGILHVVHNDAHALSTIAVDKGDGNGGGEGGLSSAVVGIETGFMVESRDQFGNLRVGSSTSNIDASGDGSSDVFLATLTGPGGYQVVTSSAVYVIRSSDSSVQGFFRLSTDGETTTFDLPHDVSAATLQVALCTMNDVEVQVEVTRRVDDYGNYEWRVTFLSRLNELDQLISVASSDGTADVSDTLSVTKPASGGLYPIRYSLYRTGTFQLSIETLSGSLISGSTYTVEVSSGAVDASSSYVEGKGLYSSTAGEQASFLLQARDVMQPEIQIIMTSADIEGTFTLTMGNETTEDISIGATEEEMKAALEALESVGSVQSVQVQKDVIGNLSEGNMWASYVITFL